MDQHRHVGRGRGNVVHDAPLVGGERGWRRCREIGKRVAGLYHPLDPCELLADQAAEHRGGELELRGEMTHRRRAAQRFYRLIGKAAFGRALERALPFEQRGEALGEDEHALLGVAQPSGLLFDVRGGADVKPSGAP
jgi:hypothetical protein